MPLFCRECGSENPDASKFCATCGSAAIRSSSRTTAVRLIRRRFVLSLTALISLVVILGIGAFYVIDQRGAGPANVSKEVVAATGATISLGDDITVRIPPGALPKDGAVSIARATSGELEPKAPAGADLVGPAFNVDLHGQQLVEPVTVELRFDPERLPDGSPPAAVFLAWYDDAAQVWVPAGGTVDRERNVITFQTSHLSWWAPLSWNWEAWIAVLKQGLSLELSEWIDGFELLTAECNRSGEHASVDESKANNVIQGCILKDDPANPEFRVVNIKSFHIGISPAPDGPGYPTPDILGPGDDATFVANSSDQPPAVVYAEFTEPAMWRFVAELVARMLPAGDQIPDEGLAFVADGLQRAFTAQEMSEALDAGDERGAAEGLYELITGESFVETFLNLATEYGQQHGVDMMTKWTRSGVRQVLLGVASVDVIVSTTDFLANYLFNNRSQVAFTWKHDVTAQDISETDLSAIVLTVADFGSEYSDFELDFGNSGPQTRADRIDDACDPQDEAGDLERTRWVSGYDRGYTTPSTGLFFFGPSEGDAFIIGSSIDVFGDVASAADRFQDELAETVSEAQGECQGLMLEGAQEFQVPVIGDQAWGADLRFTEAITGSDFEGTITGVAFRRGRILASVVVARFGDASSADEAIRLAEALDQRILSALGAER